MVLIASGDTFGFVSELASMRFEDVFNPYSDVSEESDLEDAPGIRRENLLAVLDGALRTGVDSLWIARDLGYRGGRRTGLAMTDDPHLDAHASLLGTVGLRRATKDPGLKERTATVIWQMLGEVGRPVFLWNVFPLHPYQAGSPFSNRQHTRSERDACAPFLVWLIENLRPRTLVAIGNDAQRSLSAMGIVDGVIGVRHPSYGGQNEFINSTRTHYQISQASQQMSLFN